MKIYYIGALLLCIGWMTSCEDERFDTGKTAMPDGQFIVDYTADTGTSTRALSEDVPAGKRINSLTYLLYSEEGTLLKRREVPGLNEPGKVEEWPLTRENMTWEQREALKDTLETNTTYHAVFIANIDSTELWKDATTDKLSPLKCAGNYNDAYIELPDRAFTDRDMFYYFSKDINSADEGADRDNPYHCNVQLHRIVTRTDFFFEELPVWEGLTTEDEPATALLREGEVDGEENGSGNNEEQNGDEPEEEGSGDDETGTGNTEDEGGTTEDEPIIAELPIYPMPCILPEEIQAYLQPYVSKVVGDAYSEIIMNPITTSTQTFLKEIENYFQNQADAITEENSEEKETYLTYVSRLQAISKLIASGGESNQTFLNAILQESEGEGEEAQSKLYTHLQNWMLNRLEGNTELTALWKQFEKRESPFYAEVAYDTGGGLNQFYLDRTKTSTGSILKTTPRVAADTIATFEGKTYRGFNVVGFANPEGNVMTTVNWYETPTATQDETPYSIPLYQEDGTKNIQTGQDINEKVTIQYRPVAGLELAEDWEDKEKAVTMIVCNLETALPFTDDTDAGLIEAIKEALESGAITGAKSSLNETVLTLQWPDLSKSEVLKITPEWTIEGGNN